jgi:hypothetical protein
VTSLQPYIISITLTRIKDSPIKWPFGNKNAFSQKQILQVIILAVFKAADPAAVIAAMR